MSSENGTTTAEDLGIELTMAPDWDEGSFAMTFADCAAKASIDDVEVGEVAGAIGGGVQVTIRTPEGRYLYKIKPSDLFNVVKDHHEQEHGDIDLEELREIQSEGSE